VPRVRARIKIRGDVFFMGEFLEQELLGKVTCMIIAA
jgi:hypothetical protein